jgi:hypothetical protein
MRGILDELPVRVRTYLPKRLAGVWIAKVDSPIGLAVDDWSLLGYELAREELLVWLSAHLDAAVDVAAGTVTRRGATDLARGDGGRLTLIRVGGARFAVAYLDEHVGCDTCELWEPAPLRTAEYARCWQCDLDLARAA